MNIRILHIVPSLGPGGAERQLSLLAPAMAASGAQVAVAFGIGGINLKNLQFADVKLFPLPRRSHHDPRIVMDLRRLIGQWKPDLVETWITQMDVIGGLAARWAGVPHVVSERSSAMLYHSNWKTWLRRRVAKNARAVIANSEGGVAYWRSIGFNGAIQMIRNGVSSPICTSPANDFGLSQVPLLLAVGRLSEEKNVGVLIDAFADALSQLPAHHAIILGDGPLREHAVERIDARDCRGRIHLGGVSAEVGYWLGRADAFVSASLFEGHPNVVIEAAAAGCPLVLSDIPAHREMLNDQAALYASVSSAQALSACIVQTVHDRAAAEARAARAKAAVAGLSIESAAASYLKVYAELLAT